jgi:ABC-type branched-subunit amino acid transport system substrate-binding protein
MLALVACGGPMGPAPVVAPRSPYSSMKYPAPLPMPGPGQPNTPLTAGPIKVALLVPLSGPNAELGKAMLEAAQLALFTTGSDRLTLIPRDTAGADGAAGAARSAIGEGAQVILGPLLAADVEAVKPVARDAHLNVIAFSTATQLAGGNVFLMGFLPRQEVAREVAFAHSRGLNRFAVLAPGSQYGHVMADAFRDAVNGNGATLVKSEYFDPNGGNLTNVIQRFISGAAPAPAAPAGFPPPPPPAAAAADFDALLLPEGGPQLKQIARQLRDAGIDAAKVRLLGSGLWDDPSIAGEPALYGGWFAASPPDPRGEFESRFQGTYGHPAPRLASLAFDAAALAGALAKNGGADAFSHDAILNPSGFTGVDGLFRFTPEGLVQRGLAVLEVGPGGNTVVSPAPQNFDEFSRRWTQQLASLFGISSAALPAPR